MDFLQISGLSLNLVKAKSYVYIQQQSELKHTAYFWESMKNSWYSGMQDWQGGLKVNIAVDKAISISIMWILIQLISLLTKLPKWDKTPLVNNARWNR